MIGSLDEFERSVSGYLERTKLEVKKTTDHKTAAELLEDEEFDLFLVDYAEDGDSVREFIKVVRHHRSPSKRAALVVLSKPEFLDDAEELLSEGVGRILNPLAGSAVLEKALNEVCLHETRYPARLMLRIPGDDIGQKGLQIMQTTNVSVSGMLVRCDKPVLVGSRFSFSFEASNLSSPIAGRAAVVRIHQDSGVRDQGFGARFLRFERDGDERLKEFLAAHVALEKAKAASG